MKKLISTAAIIFTVTVIMAGCKPSAQNETKYWENNKKDLAEAVVNYPAFKDVLEKKMAEAQKIWDEAGKLTSEDPKAAKMKEANEKINELLNQFTQIKYKSQGIEDAIKKLNAKLLTPVQNITRKSAVSSARKALDDVGSMLASAKVTGDDDTKKITGEAISRLISARGAIDRAIKSLEPQKSSQPVFKKK